MQLQLMSKLLGKKDRKTPSFFWLKNDMLYRCKATFALYLGYFKTTQKLLKKKKKTLKNSQSSEEWPLFIVLDYQIV